MFLDELFEGRDAPLYHATSLFGAIRILGDDTILGSTEQDQGKGVSLTRDLRFAKSYEKVIFELNQRTLSRRHKIVPVDYWGLGKTPELSGLGRRRGRFAEAEEFVIGNIPNVSKYLISITMSEADHAKAVAANADGRYDALLKHPLLRAGGKA